MRRSPSRHRGNYDDVVDASNSPRPFPLAVPHVTTGEAGSLTVCRGSVRGCSLLADSATVSCLCSTVNYTGGQRVVRLLAPPPCSVSVLYYTGASAVHGV